MLDIKITKTTAPKARPTDESKLGFGKISSDHMFLMDYSPEKGWHDARIVPYAPFQLDPACVVFHYAQELFEGLKAYRTADNKIQLFRPECNGQRMADSSDRMCIPTFPVDDFVQAVKALVEVEKDWVPHSEWRPGSDTARSGRCGGAGPPFLRSTAGPSECPDRSWTAPPHRNH